MKKSLVLAMAMALGVTASAYAANPFSDVPAGHWAYDSVAKLAAAGVVDGYADGAFAGDKLITRYEMAQIVAKAMAKGADCDKLAAEFADELDTLGVRVAKLEKGADAVKITGQIRASYVDYNNEGGEDHGRFRTRLFVKGAINDGWTYTGRFENNQYTNGTKATGDEAKYGYNGEDKVELNWAYVSGKIGGLKADIGRQNLKFYQGLVIDEDMDAVKLQYGKDVKFTYAAAKGDDGVKFDSSDDRLYYYDVATKVGVVDAHVSYYDAQSDKAYEILNVGIAMPVAKGLKFTADYFKGDAEVGYDENGHVFGLAFGGAKAATPGSWGVYANWYDMPKATYLEPSFEAYANVPQDKAATDTAAAVVVDGVEGFEIGANYTLAKNIVAGVKYYDLEGRVGKVDAKTLWTEVVFTF